MTIKPLGCDIHLSKHRQNKNLVMPANSARMLMVGASGSVCAFNMILQGWLDFDKLWVFAKSLNQPKYQLLEELQSELGNEVIYISDNLEELPRPFGEEDQALRELNPNEKNVILIDDFSADNKSNSRFLFGLFLRSRHFNTTAIYISQALFRGITSCSGQGGVQCVRYDVRFCGALPTRGETP
jgi:hypothetical protein